MERLLRWLELPMNLVLWIALAAGAAMMVHVTADVTGRYFFGNPIEGTSEIVTYYYMVILSYLPWMWLARTDGHIKVDLFVRMLPEAAAFWLDVVVKAALVAYLALFAWQTWLQALRQTARGEVQQAGTLYLPVWPTRWLLPLAAGLMALWVVLHALDQILRRVRR